VVSNADGRIAHALERAGLADLLEVIVDSGVVGVEKPDPAIFAHALEPLGLAASQTWYLGDTVHYDAAAAEAAGMTSWIIDHGGLHTIPHPRRVTSLAEFADVVLARAV
jgi:putative hydrolase of the HAD superfamily